jgi:hypothetical protein
MNVMLENGWLGILMYGFEDIHMQSRKNFLTNITFERVLDAFVVEMLPIRAII